MFNFLKNLFKKPSKCTSLNEDHEFSAWGVEQSLQNNYGGKIIYQVRKCKKCNYIQIDKQEN